jgi:N-carbamoyl-L-amino-acid hydrolase
VPDRVEFISDIRSPSAGKLELVCKESAERARAIASTRGLNLEITQITAELPIEVPPLIREQATAALRDLGLEPVELVSMAGHDANQLARIVPAGMIFIRCKEGRSHCPEEESSIEDICLGVAALLGLVRRLDKK